MSDTTTAEDVNIICAFCGKRKSECMCYNTAMSVYHPRRYYEEGWGGSKMTEGRNEHVGACITPTALRRLDEIAEEEGKSRSGIISDAIEAYIIAHK